MFTSTAILFSLQSDKMPDFSYLERPRILPNYSGWDLPYLMRINIDLKFFSLISYLLIRYIKLSNLRSFLNKRSILRKFFACRASRCKRYSLLSLIFIRCKQIAFMSLIFLSLLSFLMIAILNPSMKNPGPRELSVFFQNVQGLVPFSQLGKSDPTLDRTKVLELNLFITDKKPDVVILNETWLDKSVKNSEVFEGNSYKVFRNDRSQLSHPSDPNDATKFRKFGGGVVIAVRNDIDVSPKKLKLGDGAEILAIAITVRWC